MAAADALVSTGDERFLAGRQPMAVMGEAIWTLSQFAGELAAHREANPTDDLMTALVQAEIDSDDRLLAVAERRVVQPDCASRLGVERLLVDRPRPDVRAIQRHAFSAAISHELRRTEVRAQRSRAQAWSPPSSSLNVRVAAACASASKTVSRGMTAWTIGVTPGPIAETAWSSPKPLPLGCGFG